MSAPNAADDATDDLAGADLARVDQVWPGVLPQTDDDLGDVLGHVRLNRREPTRRAWANAWQTRAFLHLGLRQLYEQNIRGGSNDAAVRLWSAITPESLVTLAGQVLADPSMLDDLTVTRWKETWGHRGNYTEDLLAYAFRPAPYLLGYEAMNQTLLIYPGVRLVDFLTAVSDSEFVAMGSDPLPVIQRYVIAARPHHPTVRRLSQRHRETLFAVTTSLYARSFSAYGLRPQHGFTWRDVASLSWTVSTGTLIRSAGSGVQPQLESGRSTQPGAILAMYSAIFDRPLPQLMELLPQLTAPTALGEIDILPPSTPAHELATLTAEPAPASPLLAAAPDASSETDWWQRWCGMPTPDTQDLIGVVRHVRLNRLEATQRRWVDSRPTLAFLQLGLRLLTEEDLPEAGVAEITDTIRLWSNLNPENLVALATEVVKDPQLLEELTVRRWRETWGHREAYGADLIRFLYLPGPYLQRLRGWTAAVRIPAQVSLGDFAASQVNAELATMAADPLLWLQTFVQATHPGHPHVVELAHQLDQEILAAQAGANEQIFGAFDLAPAHGHSWHDLAQMFRSLRLGLQLWERGTLGPPRLEGGANTLLFGRMAIISGVCGVPLRELLQRSNR